ncbi:MAG: hypothetical protein HC903_24690 [Methylacidiphilales bacterium]|nr:hypothetical protein [Candidatus Methylacidiphilales bacterium]NJR14604.1 hypothetical protein [Calothrix sp. CSU_2_0]
MTTNHYSPLFRLVAKFLKYFLLLLLGFAIAYLLSMSLGALHIALALLSIAGEWFWRLGAILLCLIAIVVIYESLR